MTLFFFECLGCMLEFPGRINGNYDQDGCSHVKLHPYMTLWLWYFLSANIPFRTSFCVAPCDCKNIISLPSIHNSQSTDLLWLENGLWCFSGHQEEFLSVLWTCLSIHSPSSPPGSKVLLGLRHPSCLFNHRGRKPGFGVDSSLKCRKELPWDRTYMQN
jgi:hypothetical protein